MHSSTYEGFYDVSTVLTRTASRSSICIQLRHGHDSHDMVKHSEALNYANFGDYITQPKRINDIILPVC